MKSLQIAIAGASGRMGQTLIETILNREDMVLSGALDISGSPALGRDAGRFMGKQSGVKITDNLAQGLTNAEFLIDFTRPDGTLQHLEACLARRINMIIGTTGFDTAGKERISDAAKEIGIVFAPNMSIGVNTVFKLLDIAARILNQGFDIEIIEMHHRHKVDAPSGTALGMGQVIANALGRNLEECAVYDRQGITGERDPTTIGFATLRGGDVVGDHTVIFSGIGERIEITHKSSSRLTYANGALRAVSFLRDKKQGLFDMQDVLGLK